MSREDIGLEGYQPGNGFQPVKLGIDLKTLLVLVAYFGITNLLRSYFGSSGSLAVIGAGSGALFLALGARQILSPGRWEQGQTENGARRLRIGGIVAVVLGTAVMTLTIRFLVFLVEGW